MEQTTSDFMKITSLLLMLTFMGALILIGPVSPAIAENAIEAAIDVNPNTFNLNSNGNWATVFIEFPATSTCDVSQIDVGNVVLSVNGYNIPAESSPSNIGDYDLDGIPDLMVKFDRQLLQSHMFMGSEELTVTGTADGTDFLGSDTVNVKAKGITSTILQTSDIHDHASGYGPYHDYTPGIPGDDGVTGGYARLATVIGGIKYQQTMAGIPTLLIDSGDYFMGTTYDLTASNPIALQFFTLMGYDAITLGNHEFDWTPGGLYMLLSAGLANGFNVPVVASNTIPDGVVGTGDDGIEYLMSTGAIVNKKIIEQDNGIKVGLLGLMGENADEDAPVASPIDFNHDYAFIQACVDALRNNDGVDVVVVLSHTGVNSSGNGEDAEIAEQVTGIDIIASGHSHTKIFEAVIKGDSNSIIFSPGEYGEWVSRLDFTYNKKLGRIVGYEFNLMPVDDTVPGDPGMQYMVDMYNAEINTSLAATGMPQLGDTITTTGFDLEMGAYQATGVTGLGSLCTDSVRNVANSLVTYGGLDGIPVDVGIVPNGVIRDEIFAGNTGIVTFSDVYNCLPLGISPDTSQPVPGYPMMHAYFTGKELYLICEVGLTVSQSFGNTYYLNVSGAKIDYNPAWAPYLQGVRGVSLYAPDDPLCLGATTPVDPTDLTTLYHGVVDLYAFQLLYVVNDFLAPYGLSIIPKDKDGNPIQDYMDFRIDRDPGTAGVQELKEWMALLNYLPSIGTSIPSAIYGPGGAIENRIEIVTY
ncbi:MAG: metallophosphoesterase [Desulfobacteraceae bacterium]|jgi:5'-nucleotidase/UDP-sugar diphosphatase|nr:metallophosphoesterase [Desulfobacteraceae bacterium]